MKNKTKGFAADWLMIGGAVLIAVGAGVFNLAAGFITAGVLALAGGLFLGRGLDV